MNAISPRDAAAWLGTESGLTSKQIGRALGTGPRTAASWAAGSQVPPFRVARLLELHTLISGLEADSPEGRRRLLLSSGQGRSLFQAFVDGTPRGQQIHFPIPVLERLGI